MSKMIYSFVLSDLFSSLQSKRTALFFFFQYYMLSTYLSLTKKLLQKSVGDQMKKKSILH